MQAVPAMVALRALLPFAILMLAGCSGPPADADDPRQAADGSQQAADAPADAAADAGPAQPAPSPPASPAGPDAAAQGGPSPRPVVGTCELSAVHAVTVEGEIAYASEIIVAC